MRKLTSEHVERRDVIDYSRDTADEMEAIDAHRRTMKQIKEHLQRELKAGELNDPRHEHRSALREYADLGRAAEHPYKRLVREHREKQKSE